jgi:hypothetical protein
VQPHDNTNESTRTAQHRAREGAMKQLLKGIAGTILVAVLTTISYSPANATLNIFTCHDHPNGNRVPPTYGFRADNLIGTGDFTFSFDYIDGTGSAAVTMTYNDVTGEIKIYGRIFGGKDNGGAWDATLSGWADIDFTYAHDVQVSDDCSGALGDDLYIVGENALNKGTLTLDGWGGDLSVEYSLKSDGSGCSFVFDNDTDSKGNATIANDLTIYSASGWHKPPTSGARDWLFIAELGTVPVHETSWGHVKALYAE